MEHDSTPKPLGLWPFVGGFLAYGSITTFSSLLTGSTSPGKAVLAGVLNALPEALAAPFVLRWAERAPRARGGALVRRAAWALAFAAGCMLASWGLFELERGLTSGRFTLSWVPAVALWRAAMALLVFFALMSLGAARRRTREAHLAALAAERAEKLRARAELAALRAQLHPHFLFNVLHSVAALTGSDPERAVAMIEKLGDVLRFGLRVHAEGLDEIPLGEELALTRDALEIERLRLGERLRVSWEIPEAALAVLVPPFALQSLVENAVRLAVAPRAAGGEIRVSCERAGEWLRLTVEDDGERSGAAHESTGVGHALLRERLRLLHGERATLEAAGRAAGGYRAEIRLPWREDDEP